MPQEVSAATPGAPWKDVEVDLSAYKGRRVWVVLRHVSRFQDTACSYWGKIEVAE
jgi:hypothetical protein